LVVAAPRIRNVPAGDRSLGDQAIELARFAGLELDSWQEDCVRAILGVRDDGRWASFEGGFCLPRQNGKGGVIEAVELAGLWLVDSDELQIHTAHLFPTAREAWRRIVGLIEGTPELNEDVRRINRAHGEEGVELVNGKRLLFKARGSGSGRGFSGDRVVLDESMFVKETMVGDLMPALSARPNPQVLYFGSAVDRLVHPDGVVFARVRERGVKGDDRLAYFEWSLDFVSPDDVPAGVAADPGAWAEANPAFGIRIDAEFTESERRTMSPRTFAVERLGVGDWPVTDPDAGAVIPLDVWRGLADPSSAIDGRVVLAFDVSPDRSCAAIAAGGLRDDDFAHGEVIDRGAGTGWIVPRLLELKDAHNVSEIVCDGAGPAAAVADECKRAGIRVTVLTTRDFVRACGGFFDRVANGSFRHLGEGVLEASVRGAVKRPLGDAWAWSRKGSVDATPLVAVTLAVARAGKRASVAWAEAW
jgi:hypothetical protein